MRKSIVFLKNGFQSTKSGGDRDAAAGVFSVLKAAAPTGAAPPSLVWDSDAGHGDAASERECGFREMEGQFYIELGIQSRPPPPSRAGGGGWGLGFRISGCC